MSQPGGVGARIGVVGGVGPAATILYYRLLLEGAARRTGGSHVPEILIHSLDLATIDDYFRRSDFEGLADRLVPVLSGLEQVGCDVALMACNTMHLAYDRVAPRVSIPVVNLIDAVLEATGRGGYRSVGILGTVFVMRSGIYARPLEAKGVRCLTPDLPEQDWIMAAILDDLQRPVVPPATVERLIGIVRALERQGAEAVILGCTDLPVAIHAGNSPIPALDTSQIHVDAVLDRVLAPAARI